MVGSIRASDRVFNLINTTLLTVVFCFVAYPFIYVLSASFSDPNALLSGRVWLFPIKPSLGGYTAVFRSSRVWLGYGNSFYYMTVGTAVNVAITLIAAYPLSRRGFKARRTFMLLFIFTMFFEGGMIPTYLLIRSLGMMNTRWALIIPGAIGVWNLIVARTFIEHSIPDELFEASRIDGCSHFRYFLSVVIPLSSAMIAVITLFYAVGHWNEFFAALLYLRDDEKFPLQMILREYLLQNQTDPEMLDKLDPLEVEARQRLSELLKYSLIIVGSLPVLIIYPFVQRHFVRGVMIGAIKG